MLSPRIVFTIAIVALVAELLIWKSSAPTSFAHRFDPVQPEDIRFEPAQFDLGNVAPSEKQSLSFAVTNLKKRSIVLQQPGSSCGCIRFEMDGSIELAPNETTILNLDYKAPRAPGEVVKSVLLRVASADSTWRIPFKCNVVADAWSDPHDLELVINDNKANERGLVNFTNDSSVGSVICSHPDLMEVELGRAAKNTQSFEIAISSETAGEGYIAFLDSNADHLVTVPVSWRMPRWIECCPAKVTLEPALKRDETYEIVVLRDPSKTRVLQYESQVPWINVARQWSVSEEVDRFIVEVDSETMPASFSGPIVKITDAKSSQTVSLIGKI